MSFYILNNIVKKQFYLFTTSNDKAKIQKKLPKDTITFEYDVNNYSIRDFKLLIFSLLEIPLEKQHMWIHNINISNVFFVSETILLFVNLTIYKKFNIEILINKINFIILKKIIFFNTLSLPHSLLSYSFLRIDIIILSFFISLENLGYYSFASMIIEGIYQLLTMMRDRINPYIATQLQLKKYKLTLYYKKIFINIFLFFLIFLITYFIFFPLFSFMSNYDYSLSRNLFLIISCGLFIFSISSVMEHIFLMNNKPHYQSFYIILGNLLNIILNIVLIKTFGVYGAAFATSVTFAILSLIIFYYAFKISR